MHAVDVHQHLWPEGLLERLETRGDAPFARWSAGAWTVTPPGEPPFAVRPQDHDPPARAAAVRDAGLDRALAGVSPPAGVETDDLLEAWEAAAAELPHELGWWASVPTGEPAEAVARLTRALGRGAAGLMLPAPALGDPDAAARALPLLAAVEAHGAPVFAHPGALAPGAGTPPGWWGPCADYPAQMTRAWHAVTAVVRPALPRLTVVFALLAGLAPLHAERTAQRGGPLLPDGDPRTFYETSGYGPRATRAMAAAVGAGQLLYGSDRPAAPVAPDPIALALGPDTAALARRENAARALGHAWQPA